MFSILCFALLTFAAGIQVSPQPKASRIPPKYHNYYELTTFLQQLSTKYEDFVTLYSIGRSVEERELWVVTIRAPTLPFLGVPNVKLVANIHGNEPVGRELTLYFAKYLLENYDKNEEIKWILDRTVVHILPSLNPDGFERALVEDCQVGPGRRNSHDVDINRSFPDVFNENPVPMQPETEAIECWMNRIPFVLSASFHGGTLVANYPYDSNPNNKIDELASYPSISPDDDVFIHLAQTYANNHPIMHKEYPCSPYNKAFKGGITNGAAWYPVSGGMQDYNYLIHGCMEVTLEISCCKYPAPSQLPKLWEHNKVAMLEYIKQAQRGVRGLVMDKLTSAYIPDASLWIVGRNVTFYSSENGEFWRILLPGHYVLCVNAQGYIPQSFPFTVENTNSTHPTSTWLNVYLHPEPLLTTPTAVQSIESSSSIPSTSGLVFFILVILTSWR